ncbi:PREDICTED: uncharacterized protein LOC106313589 isoform X2 [Brassica oleracea var. oleracea]|uniref:uncharacterized protein LOC106313589 isoform X2 n=1 Tax=Brassica oleracea var. oleracea TaxID=109376 RepID=UPI0006A71747|nr:PREDICTED: uncharacterized protein LOC106313589 isoform X2 [Brassica oleracea var. oleracea]
MRLFHDTKSRKGIESNSPHARATSRLFPHLFLASSSSFRLHLSSVVFAGQSLHGFHRKPSNRLCPRPAELNLLGVMRREEEEIARSMSSIIRIFVVKKLRDFYWEARAGREPSQLLSVEDYLTKQRKESGSKELFLNSEQRKESPRSRCIWITSNAMIRNRNHF